MKKKIEDIFLPLNINREQKTTLTTSPTERPNKSTHLNKWVKEVIEIDEKNGNSNQYLNQQGNWVKPTQQQLEEADELARTDFPNTYLLPTDADLQAGVFKSNFNLPDIFSTIGNPNDVNNWNQGPVLDNSEGVFIGNKISEQRQNGDSTQVITGIALPVDQDLPIGGNVDLFTSDELVADGRLFCILKSPFFTIKYEYEDLGSGEYIHNFYIQFIATTTALIEIEGDATTLSNVDLRFL